MQIANACLFNYYILTDQLEYNTEREHLIIPKYGRHLQKMINHAKTRPTKEERNKLAKAIIAVMGNLQPHLRDVADFQHKLWDQLFIMADFELDADSPYDLPSKELLQSRPEPLKYPQNHPKYRFYGNNIKTMMTWPRLGKIRDEDRFDVYHCESHEKVFLNWNKDTVEDAVIFDHLYELSEGDLDLRAVTEELADSSSLLKVNKKYGSNKKSYLRKIILTVIKNDTNFYGYIQN